MFNTSLTNHSSQVRSFLRGLSFVSCAVSRVFQYACFGWSPLQDCVRFNWLFVCAASFNKCFVGEESWAADCVSSRMLHQAQKFSVHRSCTVVRDLPSTYHHPPRDNLPEREREQHSTHHATIIQSFEIFIATKSNVTFIIEINI